MKIFIDLKCIHPSCDWYGIITEEYGEFDTLVDCPNCGEPRERVHTKTPTFVLKGDGFHKAGTF